jgi:ATP-binding cassette subfamily B protein
MALGRMYPNTRLEKPTRPIARGTARRVVRFFKPYRVQVSLVLLAIVLISVVGLANPYLLKLVVDDAILHRDMGKLTLYVSLMVAIPVVTGVIGVGQTYLNNLVGQQVMRDLRNDLYRHVQRMSMRFFSGTKTGEIQSRLGNDVNGIQDVVTNTASSTVSNFTTTVSTIVAMLVLSWQLTLLSLALLPVFLLITYKVGNLRREISRGTQRSLADMSALVEETLSVSGMLLTKAFGRQQQSMARFERENQKLADLELRQQMVGRWFFMLISAFFSITPALAYYLAGRIIIGTPQGVAPSITIGGVVAFTMLQSQLFRPVSQLLNVQVQIQGALALFDRIFEYLDMPVDIQSRPGAIRLDGADTRGKLTFDHVDFSYSRSGRPLALEDITFTAEPGQLVALVGPTGAGKTTIGYLAARLYDVTHGTVSIDGRDVRDLDLESVPEVIGMVTQETYLFHATVRENLLFARPEATDEELIAATRAANIYDRIMELDQGFDTVVGERGYRLSGGEKQRLAIARIVLKNPPILILDEATSALDTVSERLVQDALNTLMTGRTTLAIAHRLSTIRAADQILVIQRGRIVERGTHEELLAAGGVYTGLYRGQFEDGDREVAPDLDGSDLALATGLIADTGPRAERALAGARVAGG